MEGSGEDDEEDDDEEEEEGDGQAGGGRSANGTSTSYPPAAVVGARRASSGAAGALAASGGPSPRERARWVPLRLKLEERRLLRLLEAALSVSEYTDKVSTATHREGGGLCEDVWYSSLVCGAAMGLMWVVFSRCITGEHACGCMA